MSLENTLKGLAVEKELHQELNERQKTVLKEVCDAFVFSGVPVGSRTISRLGTLSCSPATIRNEMADLEEMGYLFSPHTSAGRIPTEKGYKFYVNFLLKFERINRLEQDLIRVIGDRFEQRNRTTDKVLRSAIKLACEQTKLGGLIAPPQLAARKLVSIKLYRILEDKAMLVMVDESGEITDEVVKIPPETSDDALDQVTKLLDKQLCRRIAVENEMIFLKKSQDILTRYNQLLSIITDRVRTMIYNPASENLFLEGFVNFFEQPEFGDPQKMRKMISLLDKKEVLLDLLAKTLASEDDIMVNIGSDSGLAIDDLSIVTARYRGPNHSVGQIGLIGPIRMDYAGVVATLSDISKALTRLFVEENADQLTGEQDDDAK